MKVIPMTRSTKHLPTLKSSVRRVNRFRVSSKESAEIRKVLHDVGVGAGIEKHRDDEIRRIWRNAERQGR